jgi:hypothetical protein
MREAYARVAGNTIFIPSLDLRGFLRDVEKKMKDLFE